MTPIRARMIAAATGFAVMSLELAAVRLLAPHFGDSAFVWTNVIGVMLVALAAGAWLGGRLADREHGARRIGLLLAGAGAFAALIPLVSGAVGRVLLPADIALDAAMGALIFGSLVATLVLFAPPVLVAGAVTPMLVVLLTTGGSRVGRASGLVATWSTLGSLAGTFLTTHLLVPELGSRLTVWSCSAILIACSVAAVESPRLGGLLALPLGLSLWPLGPLRAPPDGSELLAELESSYQFLQVVRDPAEPATTMLKINEGLDSFHSVRVEGTAYSGGRYYDYHAVTPFLVGDGRRPASLRVLSLGAAAGTFERIFAAAHEGAVIDSVELDPAVVELGRAYFAAFESPGRVFSGLDARVFVDHADRRYDVVLVDAYERQIYIPAHVASREFFTAVEGLLEPGGVVSVNAGGRSFDDPVVRALASTMASVFEEAWAFRIPRSRNYMVVARKGRPLDVGVLDQVETPGDPTLEAIVRDTSRSGSWRRFEPSDVVLVDDRPMLDLLQDDALMRRLDDPQLTRIAGSRDPDEVANECFRLHGEGAWEQVVATAATARAPTAYLRMLAGDARWWLHDLAGAYAEYVEARRLDVEGAFSETLDSRRENCERELDRIRLARSAATVNMWLALGGLAAFGAVLAVARRAL